MTHVHFPYRYPRLRRRRSHDRFGIDHNRCILCTRCVRVCDEIEGAHTWDVWAAGIECRVITDLNQPWGDSKPARAAASASRSAPPGRSSTRATTVAEMEQATGQFSAYLRSCAGGRHNGTV